MLTANLPGIAKQILQECKFKPEVAIPQMIKRIESDNALRGAIIHEAVSSLIRAAASQQSTTLARNASVGVDNARGLTLIEGTGYLDTYLAGENSMTLLGAIKRFMPPVALRPIKHLTTDLRNPWQVGLAAHKRRRARECRKVPAPRPFLPELPAMLRHQAD